MRTCSSSQHLRKRNLVAVFLLLLLVFPLKKLGDRADLSVTSGRDAVVVVADVDDGTCWSRQQSGPSR